MSATSAGAAKDQVARLLRLVPYLHARDQVSLEEAARVIGVPADQLEKDLRVLFLCGLPGGYPDDLIAGGATGPCRRSLGGGAHAGPPAAARSRATTSSRSATGCST